MPYHAWCPWCVTGRGRAAHHRQAKTGAEEGVRVVAMGCGFIIAASTPAVCLKCSMAGVIAAHATKSKTATTEIAKLVATDVDNVGQARLVVKSGNWPAMKR